MTAPFSALGFDPAPGDPDAVLVLSREARRVTAEVGSLGADLRRLGEVHALWQGTAAQEFVRLVKQLPDSLHATEEAFGIVAGQLSGWGATLLELQAAARALEVEAQASQDRRASLWHAAPARDAAPAPPVHFGPSTGVTLTGAPVGADDAQSRSRAAMVKADEERAAIFVRARRLQLRAEHEGARVAAAVRTATAFAPPPPGLFEQLGDRLSEIDRAVGNFVNNHIDDFTHLADACALLSLVGLVPVVGWAPGVIFGSLSLASHSALARYADGSKADVALDVAGLGAGAAVLRAGRTAARARAVETGTPVQPLPSMFSATPSGPVEGAWRWVQMGFSTTGFGLAFYGAAGVTTRRTKPQPPSPNDPKPRLQLVLPAPAAPPGPVRGGPTSGAPASSRVVAVEVGRRAEPRHLWPATRGASVPVLLADDVLPRRPAPVGGP